MMLGCPFDTVTPPGHSKIPSLLVHFERLKTVLKMHRVFQKTKFTSHGIQTRLPPKSHKHLHISALSRALIILRPDVQIFRIQHLREFFVLDAARGINAPARQLFYNGVRGSGTKVLRTANPGQHVHIS